MKKFLLLVTLLAVCVPALPQSFAKFVGKTITVESKCRGEVLSGKINRKDNPERTNNEVFVLADAQTLVWSENCHLNIYNVTINSDGDLDVETTIMGTPRQWFQLLKAENGSLRANAVEKGKSSTGTGKRILRDIWNGGRKRVSCAGCGPYGIITL